MWQAFQHILPQASRHFVLPPSPHGAESHFHWTGRCTHGARNSELRVQWCESVSNGWKMLMKKTGTRHQKTKYKGSWTLAAIKQIELDLPEFMSLRGGLQKRENQSSCVSLCQVQYSRFRSFQLPFITCKESRDLWSATSQKTLCEWPCTLSHGSAMSAVKNRSVVQYSWSSKNVRSFWFNSLPWTCHAMGSFPTLIPVFKFNCFLLHKYPHSDF